MYSGPAMVPGSCVCPLEAILTGPVCICMLIAVALQTYALVLWLGVGGRSLALADWPSWCARWEEECCVLCAWSQGCSHSALALCPPGVLGLVKMPPQLLSLLGVELSHGLGKVFAFLQKAAPSPVSFQSHVWSCALGCCCWWMERRSPYLLPLPPAGSSTSTFRHMAAWISQTSIVLCMSSVGLWMSFSLCLSGESLREELPPPWCWHHSSRSFFFRKQCVGNVDFGRNSPGCSNCQLIPW